MDMLREAIEVSIAKEIDKSIEEAVRQFRKTLVNNRDQYLKAIMEGIKVERGINPMGFQDEYYVKIVSKQEV